MLRRDLADTLRAALEKGGPANLAQALEPWDDRELTAADAEGLVAVLAERLEVGPLVASSEGDTILYHLAMLFQNDAEDAATRVLATRGMPELVRLFDAAAEFPDCPAEPLVIACEMFALYAHKPGVPRIAATARRFPDEYLWEVVFGLFAEENHPYGPLLTEAFCDGPPTGFAAVALLDLSNSLARRKLLIDHPFDTPQGRAQLSAWLRDPDTAAAVRAEAEWIAARCRTPLE